MATTVYRNADLRGIVAKDLPLKMATIHKEVAKEFAIKEGYTRDVSVFAFRGSSRPRKFETIDAIPHNVLITPATIGIVSKHGENYAVEIATEFLQLFNRMAPVRGGAYKDSIRFLLNGRMRALSTMQKIQESNPLRQQEVVTVFSAVEYASTLEAPNYNADGIFLKIANILIPKWGGKAAIKFAYASGMRLSQGFKYATPMLVISGRGSFATSTATKRGQSMRRRKRVAKKAELASLNVKRMKAGLKPYKRMPRRRA